MMPLGVRWRPSFWKISVLPFPADLPRLACSTRKILGVAPVVLARTPLEYLVSFCFMPVGSAVVSYLGGLSTTKISMSNSLVRLSATSNIVLD